MAVELGYFAIPSPDPERSRAFWGAVFGWSFAEPDETGFIDIDSTGIPGGIAPMPGETVLGWFRTQDIHALVARVAGLGGDPGMSREFSFGWTATCRDDQGVPFNLWQMAPGLFAESRRGDGHTAGEPGYFVLHVPDVEAAASFYGPLFGWAFDPPAPNGYRHANNLAVPGGIFSANEEPGLHLFFRTADIAATIARIRANGGSAADPEASDSGLSTSAQDNQDVRFFPWEPAPGL